MTDPSGSVVAGAHVSARRTETNRTSATLTDHEGRFRLPYLKVGAYEVTVSHPGFAQAVRPVTLTVGSAFELAIALSVAGEQSTRDGERGGRGGRNGAHADRRHGVAGRGAERCR